MTSVMRFLFPAESSREQREQIFETFKNLREQIPQLYAVALVNLIGIHVATLGSELTWLSPITALSFLLVWRMIYWLFFQKASDDIRLIRRELIKMVIFTVLLCLGFSIWAQLLITAHPDQTMTILLYSVLSALGAAYGLSSFPRAALLPLVLLGLPVAGRLLLMDAASSKGIGFSLAFVLLLFMRLLYTHSEALADLVSSRMAVAKEHYRAISAETAALKKANEDALTGLANRAKLVSDLDRHLVKNTETSLGSVLAITDLDGFKPANDAFGHAAGDAILKTFANRLSASFSERALVARMGGDEFAIFWRHGLSKDEISHCGAQICEMASEPIEWEGKKLTVGASCGLTEAGAFTSSIGEFLRQADSALYKAKGSGRGGWQFYDEIQFEADQRRATLERLLLNRAAHDEMTIEFQPIVCVETHRPIFVEALARWHSPQLGEVSPNAFIQIAEQLGAVDQLNDALLRKAIACSVDWPEASRISFNLSALQISQPGASDHLLEILSSASFPPERIQFEVTETAFLADMRTAKKEMDALRGAGCMIALDDFGAGNSSVSYLRELSFDVVKLDGSLVTKIQSCERSRQILLGLVDLCHAAQAQCVAEYVETREQFTLIKAMGCDFAQGFYLGKPIAKQDVARLWAQDLFKDDEAPRNLQIGLHQA